MATNTLLTPTVIANELLMRFKNNIPFASGCSHEYDGRFNKIGDTYSLRVPVQFAANSGADITSQIQDVVELSKPLTINTQRNVAFEFSAKDLSLTIDRFSERYLDSAAAALSNAFDVDGMTMAYQNTNNLVGSAGTTPGTSQVILDAGVKLDNASCPVDGQRSVILNPAAQAATVEALKGLFQSSTQIRSQYERGKMGTALGFEFAMSQNVRTHTVGSWGTTVQVASVPAEGATTLAIKGLTATTGTVKAGDTFTLPLMYAANRVSGDNLAVLQQFTVTANATADGSGNATISIFPAIYSTGARKTVSILPAVNDTLTKVGTASTGYPMNLAYHKQAFTYAMAQLEMPKGVHFGARASDEESGLSLRMVSQYNILTDKFVTRVDSLYGWAAKRPEWACKIIG
jgi:hypothetical protein